MIILSKNAAMPSSSTSNSESTDIPKNIAAELELPLRQVLAAVELLDAGNTIPFIARYCQVMLVGDRGCVPQSLAIRVKDTGMTRF
jgi:hypothetical protein